MNEKFKDEPTFRQMDSENFNLASYNVRQMEFMEEMCILVNEHDEIVGNASKRLCHAMSSIEQGMLHRAFSVFLFDATGKRLLLQQRSEEKITFPNCWTNTCCSHPLFIDEELEEHNQLGVKRAAIRKLYHELGIEGVIPDDLSYITRIHYKASSDTVWGEHEIDYILFLRKDVEVHANSNEVKDFRYVTREELEQLMTTSIKLTPWFRLIVEAYLFEWWKALEWDMPMSSSRDIIYKVS